MVRRLINCTKSEINNMSIQDLKTSIRSSEGRVVLAQNYVGFEPLVRDTTNVELSFAFGADMVLFNRFPMDGSSIPAFETPIYDEMKEKIVSRQLTLSQIKEYTHGPLGIYLECGSEDNTSNSTVANIQLIRSSRIASDENLQKIKSEGADFVVLGGNPGSGTNMESIVEATRKQKRS